MDCQKYKIQQIEVNQADLIFVLISSGEVFVLNHSIFND